VITLRRATPADCAQIARVHEESIRGLGITSYTPEEVASWAAHLTPERYLPAIENNDFFVAVAAGTGVIGFAELNGQEVAAVYVSPEHARHGVGRMLMDELIRLAGERGYETLHLCASANAVPFYEAMGFKVIEATTWRSRGGIDMRCLRMEKRLR
jgi:putative acetyltransferase